MPKWTGPGAAATTLQVPEMANWDGFCFAFLGTWSTVAAAPGPVHFGIRCHPKAVARASRPSWVKRGGGSALDRVKETPAIAGQDGLGDPRLAESVIDRTMTGAVVT